MGELRFDPERWNGNGQESGILIRATTPSGEIARGDIGQLDRPSLLAWLRGHGGNNRLAEDTVGVLLGHGHLHEAPANDAEASAVAVVHSRGLGWGPPTLCGQEGPVPEPAGEVTCDRCLDILGDSRLLAARAEEVRRTHGPPPKLIHLDDETVVNPADLPIPYVRIFVEMLEEVGRQAGKGRDDAFDDARKPIEWIDCAKRVLVDAWLALPPRPLREGFIKLGALALKAVASFDRKHPGDTPS